MNDESGQTGHQVADAVADAQEEVAKHTEDLAAQVRKEGTAAGERLAGPLEEAAKTVRELDTASVLKEGAAALHKGEEQAQHVAEEAAKRADTATRTAGGQLIAAATYLREQEGEAATAEDAATMEEVAATLEQSGAYLQDQGLAGVGRLLAGVVRNHPVLSLLGAAGLGFMLGRVAHE